MTKPTVGSLVWFTPATADVHWDRSFKPPFAAVVSYLWDDTSVNLMAIRPEGHPVPATRVTLIAEGIAAPAQGHFCEWPSTKAPAAEISLKQRQQAETADMQKQHAAELQGVTGKKAIADLKAEQQDARTG